MLVKLGLRPRSPSPDALPDETVELADEVHMAALPDEAEEGMVPPPPHANPSHKVHTPMRNGNRKCLTFPLNGEHPTLVMDT